MKYKITCESSADLNDDMYKKLGVSVIPFRITIGDEDYYDGKTITNSQLFEYLATCQKLPKTSALNELEYSDFFEEQLKDCDGIIHICISSLISSTYNNAITAAKKFDNVYVIDSLSLSSGIGLQVMYACSLRDRDVDIKKAVELIEKRRSAVQISFVVDKLTYLHKGGRCSALSLLGANLLNIKPCIVVKNGRMMVNRKYIGKLNKVLDKYVIETLAEYNNPDPTMCFITYSSATDDMLEITRKTLKEKATFKKVQETIAGCTVSTHCGPNTLGIIYYNDGKEPEITD